MKMFASKAAKSKLLAFGVVAMFVLCAVSCVADADAAGPYGGITDDTTDQKDQKFTVPISTGQTFTYSNITTNLDGVTYGTIEYTPSGNAFDNGLTFNNTDAGKSITGTFTSSGNYEAKIKAVWTAPNAGNDNYTPTQTAYQTISFVVSDGIIITPTSVAGYGMIGGTDKGDTILEIPFTGAISGDNPTVEYTSGTEGDSPFAFSIEGKGTVSQKIVVKTNADLSKTGNWSTKVTLKNDQTDDSDSVVVDLAVYDKIAITNDNWHLYTYERDNKYTSSGFTFKINYEDAEEDGMSVTKNGITFNPSDGKVLKQNASNENAVDISTTCTNSGDLTDNTQQKDYHATMSVTGTLTNSLGVVTATETVSATMTLTVYRSLEFTKMPTTGMISAKSTSAGSNSIILSSYISGAKSVKFDWNDGSTTESIVTGTAANYSVNHTYAKAGTYLITISATNDMGTTTSKVMYSVGQTSTVTPDTTTTDTDDKKDTGFFEKHGFLFIVFLILAGLLVYAAFFLGYQIPPVLIAIPICVVLAVLLFFYKDFGGIFDAIRGLR